MNHDEVEHTVAESLQQSARALWPHGVFGEPQSFGEVTIIPVARITGGAGGGGGDGSGSDEAAWFGFGSMFGVGSHPVGVYEIRGDQVRWRPSVDVDRLLRGGQVLLGVTVVCASLVAAQRSRWMRRLRPRGHAFPK